VIGAYRRHRFVEWVLGSVTRHMLHQTDLPDFMLHGGAADRAFRVPCLLPEGT